MADDYWFVQDNFKIGDRLVNIRGRDVAHLIQNAREYAGVVAELTQIEANLKGGNALAAHVVPQQQNVSTTPPVQQQYAEPAQPAAPQASGPSCVHGPRVRRTGTSQRGAWVGWFCPTPKGTPGQCKAEFE